MSITEGDVRKDFVLATVANYFGTPVRDQAVESLRNSDHLNAFLDDSNASVLSASVEKMSEGAIKIHMDNITNVGKHNDKVLVLFKAKPEVITPDNLHSVVLVNSMLSSPVSSLYHALQKIYSPLLLKDAKWSQDFDPKLQMLQSLITELEKGLGSIMRRSGDATGGDSGVLSSILTPNDEAQYWADEANSGKRRDSRDRATSFYTALEPMANEFSKIETLQLLDAEEVLEVCNNTLDDLWKVEEWEYPQNRMVHLMDVIAHAMTRFIQTKCGALDLWKAPFGQVEEALQTGVSLCEKLITTCDQLTTVFWPNYGPHIWEGGPYKPEHAINVKNRLKEVLSLRTLHKQLSQLLSLAEQTEMRMNKSFDPFDKLIPVQYSPYTEPLWRAAVTQFENSLVPAERRIAGKLRSQLRNMHGNTLQFLQEFKRYKELIQRPSIQRELVAERESLLGKLSEFIDKEKKAFVILGPNREIPGIPKTLTKLYNVPAIEARIKDMQFTGQQLLSDLSTWPTLKKEMQDFFDEVKEFQKDDFDRWSRANLEDINSKELSLQTNAQVVYFEAGKDMKVSYNKRLVGLNNEVRVLAGQGYNIPHKIMVTSELARKFSKQARDLERIASFHNTIGDRMITSQRPLMLDAAVSLAQLVKEQTDMTWNNTDRVQRYIEKLQQHVDQLARQNNKLASYHKTIAEKVVELMDIDLLKQQNKWKDGLKDIRQIMSQVEQQGFTNLKSWRSHWDHQLYKALEHQYQVGLEALNEYLPEIEVFLTYRQQQLQFQPPIEEIRMKYYSQLKRFLAIPKNFKGVSESSENLIFPTIIDRNAHRYSHLFKKAEELFMLLEKKKDSFNDWVALGSVDIEDFIQENFKQPEDWDQNFSASKARGQDIGRLPSGKEKLQCISINYAPLRTEIELLNRKYWDILVVTLQRSIINDIESIEKFTSEATDNLRRQPQTVEEIGEANLLHKTYQQKSPEMMGIFENADRKNKILSKWTKEQVEHVHRIGDVWDNFSSLMDNHEDLISRQVDAIKGTLNTDVNNLNNEIEKFKLRWDATKPKEENLEGNSGNVVASIKLIKEKRREWDELLERREKIKSDHSHFGLDDPDFPQVDQVDEDLAKIEDTWGLFDEFNTSLKDMSKEEWIIFRSKSFRFEEFLGQWYDKLHNSPNKSSITVKLLQEIEQYKGVLPVLKYVRGEIFSDQHWNEMYGMLGMPRKNLTELKFEDFLNVRQKLVATAQELQELNNRAAGEVVIRQALSELDVWEVDAKFTFTEHQASTGEQIPLIKDWKDVINKVGDNLVLLQSIKGSPYYNSFGDRATAWETKLSDLEDILNNLNAAQRKWVYLEPYKEQMKDKSLAQTGGFDYKEVFRKIDDDFRMIMSDAQKDSRVVALLRIGSIKSILNAMLERLERCQKSLNDFLEEKRASFPRFYFIGDDDLLQILGQASKPAVIQTHLKKLFAGIYNVNFDDDNKHIISMNSIEGEIVPLKNQVRIRTEVEQWLSELAKGMKETLRQLLVDCLRDINANKNELDPLKYPSQVLCLAEAIQFTESCEQAIKSNSLSSYLEDLRSQLESYTSVELDEDDSALVLELKLKALILDTIHYIQVVESLMEGKVRSLDDWLWKKQLRFYMGSNDIARISMVDADFEYTYEYQGNAPKLVHTPLTDKCYLTLTQGMRVGLGGNPYGPAGTGKTESVKALGGIFGRQVLVFNCDEGIDVKSMGRIFIGLIKCGAWGCFDEFNRLEEQTLSAVSMQIQPIQSALRSKKSSVMLLEKEIPLNPNSGIFVTMNPAGKGYGGRQKLPDNLKQLFRPVAMSKPDNDIIAEVSLYSEGFKDAKNIGQKLVNIFTLSSKLLTTQQHYDWGLRALKTVLKGCGNMLKMMKKNNKGGPINESDIVVQALRLNTLSKLTYGDSLRFDTLVKDVFPNVAFNNEGYEDLKTALRETFTALGFIANENQVKKAIELYEQLKQRMGVVIVGPSGSGKTTLFTILKHALSSMGKVVKQHTMNPKAIPRTQLLGQIDLDTREWTNGVLTVAALEAVEEPTDVNTWIVCDGDVDPEWVESLNSVLDDNRLLTLPSGWRIQFGPNVNFIFETHDLTFASPATISRMGMIFLSDEDTDIQNIVHSWIGKQEDPKSQELLNRLVDEMFFKAVDWCIKTNDFVIDTSLVGCVLNGLSHMSGVSSRLEFAVALLKGLVGNTNEASKDALAKEIFGMVGESPPGRKPSCVFYNKSRDRLETYDSDVNVQLKLSDFRSDGFPVVQTSDVKGTIETLMHWLNPDIRQPFLLVGPEGCGKSLMLKHCFKSLRNTNVAIVHCSAHITPQHVIQKLAQMCLVVSSSNGRLFRPKECDRLILYLKDLNLAMPDKYGTCMLIAFLQQILTYGGFYDKLEWVGLEAVTIVGTMTAGTGLGRHQLSTRFTSVIRVVSVGEPDREYLDAVCSSYLGAVFTDILPSHPVWSSRSKVSQLATSMVTVYANLKKCFSVDDKSHYTFTPKHLTEWCLTLVRYLVNEEDKSPGGVLETWAYESCRLFRDKLANEEDQAKFDSIMKGVLQADWNSNAYDNILNTFFVTMGDSNYSALAPLPFFGRKLGQLTPADWEMMVEKGSVMFARENRDLDTVLVKEMLDLVARCDRVLSTPGGSLLMCGRSGVGRRTAVSIVSALHQAKMLSLKMGKHYGVKQFKNELKAAMQLAGVDGDQVFFLIEDHNLISLQFLDMINSLLSAGEVPGLYTPEELEPLLTPLRINASNEGYSGNLISYFAQTVRKNLHVILIADVTSPDFVQNCESNPALYKECQVQWMEYWSEKTMIRLPKMLLTQEERVEGDDIGKKDEKKKVRHVSGGDDLLNSFYRIESTLPPEKTSVKKYVTFIKTYQDVYNREKNEITTRQDKLSKGVSKLVEAKTLVTKLKGEAAIQEKVLAEKQKEANEALQMIKETMQNASHQKSHMEDLRGQTLTEEKNINIRKKDIDLEMAEIEPLVLEAKKAVGNIKNSTLSEIRALRAPPEVIRDILEGVLCLMGVQDTSWNSMKTFLAKRGVKEEILAFDARRVNPKSRQMVETLLEERSNSFDPAVAKKASSVAAPLASWVLANVKFSYVLDKIKPLEQEQSRLQRGLKMAEDQIGQLSTGLDEVDVQVQILQERLNKFTKEAAMTEIQLNKTKETIEAADGLVAGLESEFDRWNKEVENMDGDLKKVPFFCLLGSAFITYLSNAPEDVRKKSMDRWQSMFGIQRFDLKHFLSSEREMLQWRSEGLPSDDLSIENAMCVLQAQLSPYLIDPSARAAQWLKTHLEHTETPFEVTTQEDDRFILTLELAIRFGKTLVVEQVNSVSPILFPILRKDLMGQGVYKVVQIGDKQVDFNPKFKLYLTTRNDKPDIPPDAAAILSLINFTTTIAGLTGQLLATTLHHEKPELEQRKSELLKVEEEHKIQISKLEDFLLEQLASSQGNILENKELLASLNDTKDKSASIAASLKESTTLQVNLETEGNVYLPVAKFASTMFFTLIDLTKLNNMYRISLTVFTRLFERTLTKAPYKGDVTDKRNKALRHTLQDYVYQFMSRSLFKADRLAFAMHLVHGMYPDSFAENEWEAFTGLLVNETTDGNDGGMSLPGWVSEDRLPTLAKLRAHFPTLYENLQLEDNSVWSAFSRGNMSDDEDVPVQLSKKLTQFQKVLTIQALRPERLVSCMENFVQSALNLKELSPPALSLKNVYTETVNSVPVLIIISSGSDPSEELRELSVKTGKQLIEVAMGQGQAVFAVEMLHQAAQKGDWLCLKNLHLMTFWISILEKELQSLSLHDDFRLWLTAESHSKFPATLAESCLKVTYESPPGIKRNLQRTLNGWGAKVLESSDSVARAQAVFALAWFHAVVQERRIFIPQGWCKFYEFSDGDLKAGLEVLDQLSKANSSSLDWGTIHGLYSNAIYGGRVDDVHDIRILVSYLQDMFNPEVIAGTARSKSTLGPIELPVTNSFASYLDIVNKLPEDDKPSMFGLPANIQQSYQRTRSTLTINQLRTLMRSLPGASKFEREKWHNELNPVLNLWKKLNQGSTLLQMKMIAPAEESISDPIKAFVQLEFYNAVNLIQFIHKSMASLVKVIRGSQLLDEKVSQLAESLMGQETPGKWQKMWDGPEDPMVYLKAVVDKATAVQKWNSSVERGNLLNSEVDLSDLFNPGTFLGALRQRTAREYKISMDELKFSNSWSRGGVANAKIPVKVTGIMIEGAFFDGVRMSECAWDSPTYSAAPTSTFAWIPKSNSDHYRPNEAIRLPLYNTNERDKILTFVHVPSGGEENKWLQAGAVLFLDDQL